MVIWLIGLSRAGKTEIGREVYALLKAARPNVVFLDGDAVREVMGNDLGHTVEDRRKNAWRICRLCKLLDDQGIDVVCSILSIFPETQAWNRAAIPRYFQVYIRVPLEQLIARDARGLYRRAQRGEARDVVGVDIAFPEPVGTDLVLDNDTPGASFREMATRIVAALPWPSA